MKTWTLFSITTGLVLLDQLTKWLSEGIHMNSSYLLSIQSTLNTGSSFGMLSSFPYYNQILSVLSILLLIFLILKREELFKMPYGNWVFVFACAGIAGNLIDRLFIFAVRDFIALKYLFTFNLADFYLTLTGFFLIKQAISENKNIKRKNTKK